jgi:hypothetical protein
MAFSYRLRSKKEGTVVGIGIHFRELNDLAREIDVVSFRFEHRCRNAKQTKLVIPFKRSL